MSLLGPLFFDNRAETKAARIITQSNKEQMGEYTKTLKDISEAEIKSKDRVDIPLSEYDRLCRENSDLQWRLDHLNRMIIRMGIPAEVIDAIDPESIEVLTCKDFKDFKTKYKVLFSIDDFKY